MSDYELSVTGGDLVAMTMNNGLSEMLKPLVNEIYLITTYIAGTMYIYETAVFDEIEDGCELSLKREPDNDYDTYAILVLNRSGRKLGYVPRNDNRIIARLMDAGKQMKVTVKEIERDDEDIDVSIRIYMIDF